MSDQQAWAPVLGLVVLAWVGFLAAALWCGWQVFSGTDPAGAFLAGCAAAVLGIAALFGSRARPRLRADPGGLTVGGLWREHHHPWPNVAGIGVLPVRRWGRSVSLLQIETVSVDGHERLLVFGRLELGADPEDVAPDLRSHRPI